MLDDFHFIRPVWLWLLAIIPLLGFMLWHLRHGESKWQGVIDKNLLSYLIMGKQTKRTLWPLVLLMSVWFIAVIAMAGPSWQKLAQAQYTNQKPLVLLVDLSPSMLVEDIKPSRLAKVRFKLIDLLKERQQGLTALVVYAGDAHVLAPLSDDSKTLQALVPTLSPRIMPIPGSNVEEGFELAIKLLQGSGSQGGDILWVTDGVTEQGADNVAQVLKNRGIRLSVIGVGSLAGAPIPLSNQGFAKDNAGNIVLAKLQKKPLQKLANQFNGFYSDMVLDNRDIEQVLALADKVDSEYLAVVEQKHQMDQWDDFGQWLTLGILALAGLAFRRGWILQVAGVSLLSWLFLAPQSAEAFEWQDLWQTSDQQATKAYQAEDYQGAAKQFSNPQWRAAAQYKSGDYSGAAKAFAAQKSATGYYNQGNALANSNQLKEAIKAYDKALLLDPDLLDAQANKVLVEKLMQDQQSQDQQSQDQQSQDQQSQDQQSQDQQSQDQQSQDQQSQDQQSQDQQSQDQQSQDQQSQDQQSQDQESQDQQSQDQQSQDSSSDNQKSLQQLQEEQRQKQQQALEELADIQADEEASATDNVLELSEEQQQQQQLEKWLGQLPEDASGLIRNKFNYEFEKKRQAYQKGEWKPVEEQRW